MRLGVMTCAIVAAANIAHAELVHLQASLDGAQEVPANLSLGTGFATVILNTETGNVQLTGMFEGLSAPATAAHIHGLAPAGVNAAILFPLTVTMDTSGTLSGSGTLSAENVTGMLQGLTYVNIHNADFPGGEIRGQLLVPVPGSAALVGLGLIAICRRR